MHVTVATFLMVLACVLFLLAGMVPYWTPNPPRINLIAFGLFAWALAVTIGGFSH